MSKLAELFDLFLPGGKVTVACVLVISALLSTGNASAHPLQYHLEPLDARTVERVLSSFELLTAELEGASRLASARLPDNAMGVTALLWSLRGAVADLDQAPPIDSPALQQALEAAGYERSPYMVAEWQMEAERVLESYEVLRRDLRLETVYAALSELDESAGQLDAEQAELREFELLRQLSMLQTTARDVAQVAPYRDRLDALAGKLNP